MSKRAAPSAELTTAAQERLRTLFDNHVDRLYRLARRLAPSADDALDLVQETFLKVARSSTRVPSGPVAEEAWLVRILVNIRRDQSRREAVRRRSAPQLGQLVTVHPNPERLYVLQVVIGQGLDALSTRRRAILVMHELEGLTVPAIALLLGITTITVRWHLARARHELTRRIRPNTGATDEHTHTSFAGGRPAASRGNSQL